MAEIYAHQLEREAQCFARFPRSADWPKQEGLLQFRLHRYITVTWLYEINFELGLRPETYFLAVALFDRCAVRMTLARATMQCVAVTCCFLASKYEEIHPILLDDCVYFTAESSTGAQVTAMERQLLREVLDYQVGSPTVVQFLQPLHWLTDGASADEGPAETMLWMLAELASLSDRLAVERPSRVAAACVLLVRHFVGRLYYPALRMLAEACCCTTSALQSIVGTLFRAYEKMMEVRDEHVVYTAYAARDCMLAPEPAIVGPPPSCTVGATAGALFGTATAPPSPIKPAHRAPLASSDSSSLTWDEMHSGLFAAPVTRSPSTMCVSQAGAETATWSPTGIAPWPELWS